MKVSSVSHSPNQYTPVKKDLTSKANYKRVLQGAEGRQKVLQEFLDYVLTQLNHFKRLCTQLQNHDFLLFNDYISEAFDLISECWCGQLLKIFNQQIRKAEDVSHNPEYQESLPLQCTIYEAQKFENLQNQLVAQLKQQNDQIQVFFDTAKKYTQGRKKVFSNYFNPDYLKEPYIQMSRLYHYIEEAEEKNRKLMSQLEKNRVKFLSIFGNFRSIAVRNRFLFEKKFEHICMILVEGIKKKFTHLLSKMKAARQKLERQDFYIDHSTNDEYGARQEKSDSDNRISKDELFSVYSWSRNISDGIYSVLQNSKEERVKFNKKICTSMREEDGFPSRTLHFFLEIQERMLSRFTQIANNLNRKTESLEEEQNKIEGYLRSVNTSYSQGGMRRKASGLQRIPTTSSVIYGIFDDMVDPLKKFVDWTETALVKQKNMMMDEQMLNRGMTRMSVQDGIDEEIEQQEMWMFEDWKSPQPIRLTPLSKVKDQLVKIKTIIESQKRAEGRQLMDSQKCHLFVSSNHQKKGVLYIYENCVRFVSQNDFTLSIPYESISKVKLEILVIKWYLILYTPVGKIYFINPQKAIKCKQKISERLKSVRADDRADDGISDQASSDTNSFPKWKSVELTPSQVSGMEARKAKVAAQLPDKVGWVEVHPSNIFKNVTIDQFFSELYSDAPKQIGGRKWQSFNHYLLESLGGNSNIQDGKYTTRGPKFYTLEDDQTFQNCPSFSERTNNYQHALSGVSMPFLPKFCKCKEVAKLYWISNEEFAMLIEAYTSGAPMADSFYVRCIHHARRKGDDVEVSYHATVVFTKDTSLRRILQSKCIQEIKNNLPKTVKLQQNRLRSVVGGSKGDSQIPSDPESKQLVKQESNTGNAPSTNNANTFSLVAGIIAFLVAIKLFKMILL